MYDLPDFSPIERAIPWAMPHGDPVYLFFGAIALFLFSFISVTLAFRFIKWLES